MNAQWPWALSRRSRRLGAVMVLAAAAYLAAAGNASAYFGEKGSFAVDPNGASDIAADAAGDVYVVGSDMRIRKFSSSGQLLAAFGGPGTGPGQFQQLGKVAASPDGTLYAADYGSDRKRVVKFTSTGQVVSDPFVPNIGFLATDAAGDLYVAGTTTYKYAPSGALLSSWSSELAPIAVDSNGNTYQYSNNGAGIFKTDSTGRQLARFPIPSGTAQGQVSDQTVPTALAADQSRGVWLADPGNSRIERFDSRTGEFLASCSGLYALGLAVGGSDLFVSSREVHRFGEVQPPARPCDTPRPPTVSGASLLARRFHAARRPGGRGGTAVRFTISRSTRVSFRVARLVRGARRPVGSLTYRVRPGSDKLAFSGWVKGRRLRAGRYVLRMVTEDAATKQAVLVRELRFTVLRGA